MEVNEAANATGGSATVPAKKWTEWSVVSASVGTLRCKRTNVEDEKDVEYREVARPSFSPEELVAMVEFGSRGLLSAAELVNACYSRRYRTAAFHLCGLLNGEGK